MKRALILLLAMPGLGQTVHYGLSSTSGQVSLSGLVVMTLNSCPAGTTEVSSLNGRFLQGTIAANNDVGTSGGNATITPTGTVSQPTLTMNAYTPAGSVSAPTFTGSAGTVPAQTFTGSAGTVPAETFTGSSATTSATSGGTPAGTISALTTGADSSTTGGVAKAIAQTPTFTGSALSTHTHTLTAAGTNGTASFTPAGTNSTASFTPAGTNSAPAFTGNQATLTGTVSQPTVTINAVDPRPQFIKVIFCSVN